MNMRMEKSRFLNGFVPLLSIFISIHVQPSPSSFIEKSSSGDKQITEYPFQ